MSVSNFLVQKIFDIFDYTHGTAKAVPFDFCLVNKQRLKRNNKHYTRGMKKIMKRMELVFSYIYTYNIMKRDKEKKKKKKIWH